MAKMTGAQKNALAIARANIMGTDKPKRNGGRRRKNVPFLSIRKGGPTKGVAGIVNSSSKIIAQTALIVGTGNIISAPLTGRTPLSPFGTLGSTVRPANADGTITKIEYRNPWGVTADSDKVLLDSWGYLTGTKVWIGQPVGAAAQFKAWQAASSYNLRSMMSRGTRGAIFGYFLGGLAAKAVDRTLTPMVTKGVGGVMNESKKLGRAFGG